MTPPVELGLILSLTVRGLFVGSYEKMREAAQEAERMGFHSVWQCDHFFSIDPKAYAEISGKGDPDADESGGGESGAEAGPVTLPLLDSWVAISALARDTKTIRLGHLVNAVGYRPPALLGRMAATLDVISGGRLEFGIGAGWLEPEYRAYSYPFPKPSERIEQLGEAIQLIRRMWTDPAPSFEGKHFRIENAYCDPPPLQKPSPPIWIGGEGDKLLRTAALWADGFNARWWPPERFAERVPELREIRREAGGDPEALQPSVMLMLIPEKDPAAAAAERKNFAVVPDTGVIAGDPETCVRRLSAYVDAGVGRLLLTIPDVDKKPHRLRLAGEEIRPALAGL